MRLIIIIIIFAIFLAFIVANLEDNYRSDVSFFWIKDFEEVPVFVTAFMSFVLGMLVSVPFVLLNKKRKKPPQDEDPASMGGEADEARPFHGSADRNTADRNQPKKKLFKKKNRRPAPMDEIKKETSSYGID